MDDWSEAEGRVERAYNLYELGKWAEALRELRAAVRINPYNADWFYNMGLTLDAMSKYREAIQAYRQALALSPTDVETLTSLGVDSTRQEEFKQALKYFEKAQKVDPGFEPCYCYRIVTYNQMGEHDKAEEMFYRARQIRDKCPTCDYNIGMSLLARGKYDQAIGSWREALELDPEYPDIKARIAEAYWGKGDLDKAAKYYRLALQDDLGAADVLLDYGSLLMDKHELSAAVEKFNFVLELDPGNLSARACLGEIALLRGKPARGVELLEEVVTEDWQYPVAHLHLGQCYTWLGRVKLARKHLLAEWENRPGERSVLLNLGQALLQVHENEAARATLKRLLVGWPDSAQGQGSLGSAYLALNRLDKAVKHCSRALELNPSLLGPRCDLAWGYLRQGRTWMAVKQIWGILKLLDGDSKPRQWMLRGLWGRLRKLTARRSRRAQAKDQQ